MFSHSFLQIFFDIDNESSFFILLKKVLINQIFRNFHLKLLISKRKKILYAKSLVLLKETKKTWKKKNISISIGFKHLALQTLVKPPFDIIHTKRLKCLFVSTYIFQSLLRLHSATHSVATQEKATKEKVFPFRSKERSEKGINKKCEQHRNWWKTNFLVLIHVTVFCVYDPTNYLMPSSEYCDFHLKRPFHKVLRLTLLFIFANETSHVRMDFVCYRANRIRWWWKKKKSVII